MNNSTNDEIFYSDDESSDGESNVQMSSALSYHPSPSSYPSSSSYRSPAPYIETPCKPHTHGTYASSMNIGSPGKNYVQEKKAPATPSNLSYSAAAKKAGDVPQEPSVRPRVASMTLVSRKHSDAKKSAPVCEKPSTSATKAGFYFNHSQPAPDPRFPIQNQVMIGPVPCVLAHDILYMELREILYQRGRVVAMFLHKNAIKLKESGKLVKFGYAVFDDRSVAQKLVKQGSLAIADGVAIKISPMIKN